ncbi:MAG: imelysin family protein [Bacteroidota bacterium]
MRLPLFVLALALTASACDSNDTAEDQSAALSTYANVVAASYEDSYDAAVELDQAIDAFVAAPSQAGFDAAKQAWLASREPYGQTEAYRFANGPIDAADGPEGLLNAWPLDESYVDYVVGDLDAGIINRPGDFPTIDQDLILDLNEQGGEENVSAGYHAIEFLLWGQDLSATGAGERPYTDYTTAANADRRRDYLAAASDLLLVHLQEMVDAWETGASSNYRQTFTSLDAEQALRNVFTGIGTLAKSELAVERMFVAVNNQDQEDEHSCFADNTHRDIITNAEGIANVWRGSYTRTDGSTVSGTSLSDLVRAEDAALADEIDANVTAALTAVNDIPVPFDQAIINDQQTVLAAVDALQTLGDSFVEGAAAIGIQINNELPD